MTRKLTYPAPKVCSVYAAAIWDGIFAQPATFTTRPWTVEDVEFAVSGGAWFDGTQTFHDTKARQRATELSRR